jgi:ABC-type uncharacterized transport system ATPase subunit
VAAKAAVRDLAIEEPDIEDVVRRIYAESASATAGRSSTA